MQIKLSSSPSRDFLLCILLVTATILSSTVINIGWVQFIFAAPMAAFLPGFSWVSLFYPIKDASSTEVSFSDFREFRRVPSASDRIILSIFISLAITSVIQFYKSTYSILPGQNILIVSSVFYLLLGSLSYLRSLQFPEDDLFTFTFELEINSLDSMDRLTMARISSLALITIFSVPALQSIMEYDEKGYSEIFILNSEGDANDFVVETSLDEAFSIFVGVNNHQGETYQYRLEYTRENYGPPTDPQENPISTESNSVEFSLQEGGKYLTEYAVSFQESGLWKVEYEISRAEGGQQEIGSVFLWVLVTQ